MKEPLNYIEIKKENLLHNLSQIKSLFNSNKKVCAVVKANAYGHGCKEVVKILNNKVDYFQVDDFLEFKEIYKTVEKPILVLGYVSEKKLENLIKNKGIPAIFDLERAVYLNEIGKRLQKKVPFHLKIDALLGRQGLLIENLQDFLNKIEKLKFIDLTGVYSHFSDADNVDSKHTYKQGKVFNQSLKIIRQAGYKNFLTHMASTAGLLEIEQHENNYDMIRPGIGLYGLWPSKGIREKYTKLDLKPVLSWISHVIQVKTLPKNYPISYNCTYVTKRETKIAVIPQGYSDGYDRKLSNQGKVLIKNKVCPVLGRVAMNMIIVDVTRVENIRTKDKVTLIGQEEDQNISANFLAEKANTINYEIISRISPLLPRKVV